MAGPRDDGDRAPAPVADLTAHISPRDDALLDDLRVAAFDHPPADTEAFLGHLRRTLPEPPRWLRLTLVFIAVAQLVVVLPWLVDRDPFDLLDGSAASHLTRDGALGLAISAAALFAAARPRWAVPCFAIASVTLVAQALSGLIDESGTGSGELVHLPSIVLTCLIGASAVRLDALAPTPGRRGPKD